MKVKIKYGLLFLLLFAISFYFRFKGLTQNHPFWVDEFYTASQAHTILKYFPYIFNNPNFYFEYHNIIPHFLVAIFIKIFGQQEFIVRLPFVIVGSFIPIIVFTLTKYIFNIRTAINAALLTTFSYFAITWSRQARSYAIQQVLVLMIILVYFKLIHVESSNKKTLYAILLLILAILGILTHSLFYLILIAITIHFLINQKTSLINWLKKPYIYIFITLLGLIFYLTGFIKILGVFYSLDLFKANNFWYYHSFLWREYGLITFLSLIGLAVGFLTKKKFSSLIAIFFLFHLLFILFFFKPYQSRYIAPLFPLIYIFTAYAITYLCDLIIRSNKLKVSKLQQFIIPILIVLFIIANGYKFVTKPKSFYSVNHDFREIALIDYHQMYGLIKQKIQLQKQKVAIIDTLPDRVQWYLGYDYQTIYHFLWGDVKEYTNGILKQVKYVYNDKGEKVFPPYKSKVLVVDLSDLKRIMSNYKAGFIFIDDSTLSKDIIEFSNKNLKKELFLDHYPLDDNPYSIWPATLYSWGIK